MAAHSDDAGSDAIVWVVLLILLFVGLSVVYASNTATINRPILIALQWSLQPFAWFSDGAARSMAAVAEATATPGKVPFENVLYVIEYVGTWWRWPSIGVIGLLGWRSYHLGVKHKYRRRFDARTLLENNRRLFPSIAPALKVDLLSKPQHAGPWRMAETPIEYAVNRELLVRSAGGGAEPVLRREMFDRGMVLLPADERDYSAADVSLDRAATTTVLSAQLGSAFTRWTALPAYQRGLAAAFVLFGIGKREEAYGLLDEMALSYDEYQEHGKTYFRLESGEANDVLRTWLTAPGDRDSGDENTDRLKRAVARAVERHSAFASTWLAALLAFARRKGELAPSRFIWLRPVNRTLWYALQQLGGRTPQVEAAGIWAHMMAEDVLDRQIDNPEVGQAVEAMEDALREEGWLTKNS